MVSFFHMDAAGAAITTITAQAVSVLISLSMIRKRELPFQLSIKDIRPKGSYIGHILKLGISVAFQDMLVNISFLVIMAIVNSLGLTASAGVGVSQKMCGFLMLVHSDSG